MKKVLILVVSLLVNSNVFAFDFKGKLIEAAKDKKTQEQAKEIAKKGIEYYKGDKAEEVKTEAPPEQVAPPVVEKPAKKTIVKKTEKKKAI